MRLKVKTFTFNLNPLIKKIKLIFSFFDFLAFYSFTFWKFWTINCMRNGPQSIFHTKKLVLLKGIVGAWLFIYHFIFFIHWFLVTITSGTCTCHYWAIKFKSSQNPRSSFMTHKFVIFHKRDKTVRVIKLHTILWSLLFF